MTFDVAADAYDRFMGRYSTPLAPVFADFAGIARGQRVLDVGCGPGALTGELVRRLEAASVSAVDPSESFVDAIRQRQPAVDARRAPAEDLPFEDAAFDAALAQLVVHFMTDPVAGLREMARVTRPGGVVAACVWDHAGGAGPLSTFWEAVHELDATATDESARAGAREGHLMELFGEAELREIEDDSLEIHVEHPSFDAWWEPYTMGVGPAGAYVAGLDDDTREQLRERCLAALPPAPFVQTARAFAARGIAAGTEVSPAARRGTS
jgi:SAM-dependent methyltransferase